MERVFTTQSLISSKSDYKKLFGCVLRPLYGYRRPQRAAKRQIVQLGINSSHSLSTTKSNPSCDTSLGQMMLPNELSNL